MNPKNILYYPICPMYCISYSCVILFTAGPVRQLGFATTPAPIAARCVRIANPTTLSTPDAAATAAQLLIVV